MQLEDVKIYNFLSKDNSTNDNVLDFLNRTLTMFAYKRLPESLPEREIELIAQCHGYGIVTEWKDELLALWGSFAPPYDAYYRAKNVLVCNPWANINQTFEIDKDCVLFRNDPLNRGLLPLLTRYSSMMTEAEITFIRALINFRAMFVFTGDEDADKKSAEIFMKNIEEGKAGTVVSGGFEHQVGAQPLLTNAGNYITQAIEAQQYILGMLYQKIGLQSTFNMKRERLTAEESSLDTDPLRPLIDAMLEERQNAVNKINKMYGTDIEVEFNSSWAKYNPTLTKDGEGLPNVSDKTDSTEEPEETVEETVEEVTEPEETVEEEVSEETIEDVTEDTPEEVEALEEIKETLEDIAEAIKEEGEEDNEVEGRNADSVG